MPTYKTLEKVLIELGFTPDVREYHDYHSGESWVESFTTHCEISPESPNVIFSFVESFTDIDDVFHEPEFRYELSIKAPDGFEDLLIFDGSNFEIVETQRLETQSFDYQEQEAIISDLHQKIIAAIAVAKKGIDYNEISAKFSFDCFA